MPSLSLSLAGRIRLERGQQQADASRMAHLLNAEDGTDSSTAHVASDLFSSHRTRPPSRDQLLLGPSTAYLATTLAAMTSVQSSGQPRIAK